jgi:hypothetical protein
MIEINARQIPHAGKPGFKSHPPYYFYPAIELYSNKKDI